MVLRRRAATAALIAATALAAPAAVGAATGRAPVPVSPKAGAVQPAGVPFDVVVTSSRGSGVFLVVARSRRVAPDGTLRAPIYLREMTRRGARFVRRTDTYPALSSYFLNRPGTYFWQAYRVECAAADTDDCAVEGPIRAFTVR